MIKRMITLGLVAVLGVATLAGCGQPPEPEAEIVSREEVSTYKKYADRVVTEAITYTSDGLKIKGYILRPKEYEGQLPILVYNRGGNRNFGKIVLEKSSTLAYMAEKGYMVVASQYRGGGGSEGEDEFGGADVNDVTNLLKLAKDLPETDPDRVFMFGASRGGMMTYQALRNRDDVLAAAVSCGLSDARLGYEDRLDMQDVYRELVGGSPEQKEAAYSDRSMVDWADTLSTPFLIQHGTADKHVAFSQAEAAVAKLEENGIAVEFKVYEDADHSFSGKWKEMIDTVLVYFGENGGVVYEVAEE